MSMPLQQIQTQILEAQKELFGWVPVARWYQLHPEETFEMVRGRMRRGSWIEGVHWARPVPRDTWVHLRNIQAWIEGRDPVIEPFKR